MSAGPPAWAAPPGFAPLAPRGAGAAPQWSAEVVDRLAAHLAERGPAALARLGAERLLDAWDRAVERFRDPSSPERRDLDPRLAAGCALSLAGLSAGLEAVLGGVRRDAAARLWAARRAGEASPSGLATPIRRGEGAPAVLGVESFAGGLTLVVLAANLPGLAVQPLLRGLLRGDAVLLKSASAEPYFAPAFVAALAAQEPGLADAVAALSWSGGELAIETALLRHATRIEVFGGTGAIDSWRARAGNRMVAYGPRLSLGVVGPGADLEEAARGLARDVALFDQRGCLSPQAILVEGDSEALADRLAAALRDAARTLPVGPARPEELAAVQQARAEAEMRGLLMPDLALDVGTVIVETGSGLRPSPGRRTVRIHPLTSLALLPETLAPWRGRIQGVAVAGRLPRSARQALLHCGVTRLAAAGELQSPEAGWDGADGAPSVSSLEL